MCVKWGNRRELETGLQDGLEANYNAAQVGMISLVKGTRIF